MARGRSKLKLVLLSLLRDRPMHGYALMKELEALTGHRPSPGTVYPLLREMLKEGLLEVRISSSEGRVVKTYYITDKGRKLLEERKGDLEEVQLLMEGINIARQAGLNVEQLFSNIASLLSLLPRLPPREREELLAFLEEVMRRTEEALRKGGVSCG